jgi:predicted ATPase/DNA-binding CsgD family transcriptional regulator/transcriptional regulator with XRE-family HTH domain
VTGESEAPFAHLLRRLRLRAGLSQAALAERAGIAAAAVAAMERGTRRSPYARTLGALAEALGLSADERAGLVAAARRADVPVATSSAPRQLPVSNLPLPRSPLIGRDRELGRVADILTAASGSVRVVSLTGVGGVGKTSLALHVAHRVREAFTDGVWIVELASVTQAALVDRVVAEVLGAQETAGVPPSETVRAFLAPRRALVVLDNCEHVLDACARLTEVVLDGCAGVRLLVTSREPLLVRGEQQVRLAPLTVGLPPPRGEDPVDSPAVELFVARAQSVAPDFKLTPRNRPAVLNLCARLDGIPLALELAAAYVRVLAPQQILARLDDSVRNLVGADRLAPTRHQTLSAAMDWSYALLSPEERATFSRLSVFVGNFDLEAAEVVCAQSPSPGSDTAADVLGPLTGLVDKSLVVASVTNEQSARYRLLEPVRQYAYHQLVDAGEEAVTRRRHARVYADLAARAAPELTGAAQVGWLERLESDLPNLRSALEWFRLEDDVSGLVRLSLGLVSFWEVRGYLSEGRDWLELAHERASGNPLLYLESLLGLGRLAFWQVDLDRAAGVLQEARALAAKNAEPCLAARAATWLGAVRRRQARFSDARHLLEESLLQHELNDDRASAAWAIFNLALIANRERGTPESVQLNDEALRRYRALGDVRSVAMLSVLLAADLVDLGHFQRVPSLLEDALGALEATGDRVYLTTGLVTFAYTAAHMGQPLRSARLLGAVESINEALGAPLPPNSRQTFDIALGSVRTQAEATAIDQALEAGRRMSLEEAIGQVREMARQGGGQSRPHTRPSGSLTDPLTPRERAVVRLLVRGLSDRDIAQELGITARTAGVHVRNVLTKLGLRSRWQVHDLPVTTLARHVIDVGESA